MNRRRLVASLVTILVLAFGGLATVLALGWNPQLGLDLQGGASVTYQPKEGSDASDEALDQTVSIIRQRVDGLGVAEPEIIRQGNAVVVNLPGVKDQQRALEIVGRTAELRFRPVLADIPAGTDLTGTDTTSTSLGDATATTGTPATTAAATTVAPPNPGNARPLPRQTATSVPTTAAPTTAAPTTAAPTTAAPTDTTVPATDTTVPALSDVPRATSCATASEVDDPEETVILPECDDDNEIIAEYLLGPAFLTGAGVETASASFSETQGWIVEVKLQPGDRGIDVFNDWARRCHASEADCPTRRIAIVLDGIVQSAPAIQPDSTVFEPFDRDGLFIYGSFSEGEAKDLGLVLRYGALPVQLEAQAVQTVSATLGKDSLRAGIIAGVIGVLAVVVFLLLYYGRLAIVIPAGLLVSAAFLWTFVAILSETRGLTLTLAGVTGIIVSVGVTVDSYVVYLERLKDDVRMGRTLRSSATRGFQNAWRTILAADLVSLIGAAVLWWFTVGSVRGFAFFLGLSTIIDMVVSYFFTRPAVILLSQTKRFSGTRVLGVEAGESLVPASAGGRR